MDIIKYLVNALVAGDQGTIIMMALCSADDAEEAIEKVRQARVNGQPLSEEQLKELALSLKDKGRKLTELQSDPDAEFEEVFKEISSKER